MNLKDINILLEKYLNDDVRLQSCKFQCRDANTSFETWVLDLSKDNDNNTHIIHVSLCKGILFPTIYVKNNIHAYNVTYTNQKDLDTFYSNLNTMKERIKDLDMKKWCIK